MNASKMMETKKLNPDKKQVVRYHYENFKNSGEYSRYPQTADPNERNDFPGVVGRKDSETTLYTRVKSSTRSQQYQHRVQYGLFHLQQGTHFHEINSIT